MIRNSDKYQEERWNKIRRFLRLEQYRKVQFYDKASPNSDFGVLGKLGNNFCEEVFEYAKKLKNEVNYTIVASKNIEIHIYF